MDLPQLADSFFNRIELEFGPFDRPFKFHVFPFEAGGSLDYLTVGRNSEQFVTYVTWGLLGHSELKRGSLGRYELLAVCDDEDWCREILTNIGRMSLMSQLEPGETVDIGAWVQPNEAIQAVVLDEAGRWDFGLENQHETCGVLKVIGITRPELDFALEHGTSALIDSLKQKRIYPRTVIKGRRG